MRLLIGGVWILTAVLMLSCESDDDNDIPAYIYVEEFTLETNPDSEGSDRHRITDVWVNLDRQQTIGGFELPARIPILKEGDAEITLQAGVHQNGIARTRDRYDFYTPYRHELDLRPGEIDTLRPEIGYSNNANFLWLENFDDEEDFSLELSPTSTSNDFGVTQDPDKVFEGEGSFEGVIENREQILEVVSTETFHYDPDNHSQEIYLELHFRTDVPVKVGINALRQGSENQYEHMELNPTDGEWRKIYIHLSNLVGQTTLPEGNFKVFFGAINRDSETKTFYLDNIKLVH